MDEMLSSFDEDKFVSFVVLDDINFPYSCEQWGDHGISNYPFIINDGPTDFIYQLFFETLYIYPKNVIIDHEMKVKYLMDGYNENLLESYIQDLINNIEE